MQTIKNISDGPRGYWHNGSLKTLAKGEAREVEADEAKAALANEHYFAAEGENGPQGLNANTVPELKAIAEAEEIDLGDATKKADIIAAIELAREEKAQA